MNFLFGETSQLRMVELVGGILSSMGLPSWANLPTRGPSGNQTFPQGCAPRDSLISLETSLEQIYPDNTCVFSTVSPSVQGNVAAFYLLKLVCGAAESLYIFNRRNHFLLDCCCGFQIQMRLVNLSFSYVRHWHQTSKQNLV